MDDAGRNDSSSLLLYGMDENGKLIFEELKRDSGDDFWNADVDVEVNTLMLSEFAEDIIDHIRPLLEVVGLVSGTSDEIDFNGFSFEKLAQLFHNMSEQLHCVIVARFDGTDHSIGNYAQGSKWFYLRGTYGSRN